MIHISYYYKFTTNNKNKHAMQNTVFPNIFYIMSLLIYRHKISKSMSTPVDTCTIIQIMTVKYISCIYNTISVGYNS